MPSATPAAPCSRRSSDAGRWSAASGHVNRVLDDIGKRAADGSYSCRSWSIAVEAVGSLPTTPLGLPAVRAAGTPVIDALSRLLGMEATEPLHAAARLDAAYFQRARRRLRRLRMMMASPSSKIGTSSPTCWARSRAARATSSPTARVANRGSRSAG